jgi:hypothetical protein
MKRKIAIAIFIVLFLVIAYLQGLNYYQVEESNFSSVPYKGNEVLYFANSKDTFVMKLKGYKDEWFYVWNYARGIEYELIGKGHSFQGNGIICASIAKGDRRDMLFFVGKFDQKLMRIQFSLSKLTRYEKVLDSSLTQCQDIYKISTLRDTTFFKVKTLYWSPIKGMVGFEFVGIDSPYWLRKVEYHFD